MSWERTPEGEYLLKVDVLEVVIAEDEDGFMAELIWETESLLLFSGLKSTLGLDLAKEAVACELRALRDKLGVMLERIEIGD